MQVTSGWREGAAIGVGAVLGLATAGGAFTALTNEDASTRKTAGVVALAGLATAAGLGAFLLRSPATRPDAALVGLGFVGLPSLLTTAFIQNERDFGDR